MRELQHMQNDPSYKSEWQPSSEKLTDRTVSKENNEISGQSQPGHNAHVAYFHIGEKKSFPIFDDSVFHRTTQEGCRGNKRYL